MTIHYHGTPISPIRAIMELAGRHFCVSYARPEDVRRAHELGQSVMLDNGAYSYWRAGWRYGVDDWLGYYRFAEEWLAYQTTWAVIPDVIEGTEADNDELITRWPFGSRGAPVWHLHESIERLLRLAEEWPRICLGSSAEYAVVGSQPWRWRMDEAMNALCGDGPSPVWLHMLRGMGTLDLGYPFASVDSTDIGRNHNRDGNTPRAMADRWDAQQAPARWHVRHHQPALGS